MSIMDLFRKEDDYPEHEALLLFQEASKRHHISKWGIAVPLISGSYRHLVGLAFSDQNRRELSQYLPSYTIDAQTTLGVRVVTGKRPDIVTSLVWDIKNSFPTARMFKHVRDTLLDEGAHPDHEIDFLEVAETIRGSLLTRELARQPGSGYRTDIGAIICLIGKELVITREGIEHRFLRASKPIPFWATFERAGLRVAKDRDVTLEDGYYFEKSGFENHAEMRLALDAIYTLYQSRYLEGLYDRSIEYDRENEGIFEVVFKADDEDHKGASE